MKKAIYAGSFDPLTNGHLWLIDKSANLFDKLIVAVGDHPNKEYTFNVDDRIAMLKESLAQYSNIEIDHFNGEFLVNYANNVDAKYIVRGIRNPNDYEFERTVRHINYDICPDIETMYFIPPRAFGEVSSSLVKGFVNSNGWEDVVKKYVPNVVFEKFLEKFSNKK